MTEASRCSFIQEEHAQRLKALAEEARLRRDAERALEIFFLRRCKEEPENMGLETGLDVHGARRLEADLAFERISRRLDAARAAAASSGARGGKMIAALLSKRV
jgi:hypothetical protein